MMSFRALSLSRQKLWGAIISLFSGIVLLLITSCFINTREPHLYGALNDQIAYINVARNLVATGTVKSDTILPSTLWQRASRDVLYMPGHPLTIALSYKLFGFGAFQSILPSLLAYLVTMLAIYFIGSKIYEPLVGLAASFLFALFPPMLFFAFTAMSEITLAAAFTVGICVCLYLPPRLRPWLGPLCLALPFLFRETASYAVIPLALYFWLDKRDKSWRAVLFVILAVVLLAILFRLDFSAGRPFLLKANIFGDWHAVYDDAVGQQAASAVTWRHWVSVLPGRTLHNVLALCVNPDFAPFAGAANYLMLTAIAFVAVAALFRGDRLAQAVTLLNIIAVLSLVILFSVSGYRGMRYLLFVYPLNVVVIASLLVSSWPRINTRGVGITVSASVIAAAITFLSLGVLRRTYLSLTGQYFVSPNRLNLLANVCYVFVIAAALTVLIFWWRRRQRAVVDGSARKNDGPRLSLPLPLLPTSLIITVTAAVTLSHIPDQRVIRFAALSFFLSLVVVGWLLSKAFSRTAGTSLYVSLTVGLLFVLSIAAVRDMYTLFATQDSRDLRFAAALSHVHIDSNRLLTTTYEMATRYRYDHFPLLWSFLPYNGPTLELLSSRFDIGTMVVPEHHPLSADPALLASLGFCKDRVLFIENEDNYVVYQRPLRMSRIESSLTPQGLGLTVKTSNQNLREVPECAK
jgi:hypothetical protein